jgi:isoleucyl-tRNA synthetase
MPHNDDYEFDFHRPYIDDIDLVDEDGTNLTRVPDVFDCWFESGSMPYGQHHYPFKNKKEFEKNKFPAQFIAEALDQTRGWFYSLLVLGTALFGKSPYEKVVVSGLVMAEDGKKMSKSLQNYPDPVELADRVGVDAMRFYLLSSPVVKGEDINFSEKDVLEMQRKNIGRLHNVLAMYDMFAEPGVESSSNSKHVLDRWIVARLHETIEISTNGYENYELDKATRPLTDIIDDLSVWYLRRSRDRLKGTDIDDKQACLSTLRFALETISRLMAPAMPFYAEYLFQKVKKGSDAESVHLTSWPKSKKVNTEILEGMKEVRRIVSEALEIRAKQNIKVRQPLQGLSYGTATDHLDESFHFLIKDEVNVKEVTQTSGKEKAATELDTTLTQELKREGSVRDLIRAIQDARKKEGLSPNDKVTLCVGQETQELISGFEETIQGIVGAGDIIVVDDHEYSLEIDGKTYPFSIKL